MSRTDELYEELSRLREGELPDDEAGALRARIAAEPEVARAWDALEALDGALGELPAEQAPPVRLDRQVLGRGAGADSAAVAGAGAAAGGRGPTVTDRSLQRALPWAIAASLALALVWPRGVPTRVLGEGTELIEGRAHVVAGDVGVDVDGAALIRVEPARPLPRGTGQEDAMFDRRTWIAAAAGAAVTVVVLEGTAWIRGAGGDDGVRLEAGESRTVGAGPAGGGAAPVVRGRSRSLGGGGAGGGDEVEALRAEVAALRDELARLELSSTMARGQLDHYEGVAQPWPDDVPAPLQPAGFERAMQALAESVEGTELVAVDCEEFPCVGVVRATGDGGDWMARLDARLRDEPLADVEGGAGLSVWGHNTRTDDGDVQLAGIALTPADRIDDDVQQRTDFRAEQLFGGISEELLGEERAER